MQRIRAAVSVAFIVTVIAIACSRGDAETAFADSLTPRDQPAAQASSSAESAQGAALRLVLAPTGNAVRYRVRERLVGADLPNDAIGETKALTGAIAFDSKGKVIAQSSKFTVDAGTFVSDKDRRDGYVRRRLLDADPVPECRARPNRCERNCTPTAGVRHSTVRNDGRPYRPRRDAADHLEGFGAIQGRPGYGFRRHRIHVRRHQDGPAERTGPAQCRGHDSPRDRLQPRFVSTLDAKPSLFPVRN